MTLDFWIGLAAALPMAVAANLLTPVLARVGARYNQQLRTRRSAMLDRQRRLEQWFAEHPQLFTMYMLRMLYSMIPNVVLLSVALAFFLLYFSEEDPSTFLRVSFLLIAALSLYLTLDMMNVTRRVQRTWWGVSRLSEWRAGAQLQVLDAGGASAAGDAGPPAHWSIPKPGRAPHDVGGNHHTTPMS